MSREDEIELAKGEQWITVRGVHVKLGKGGKIVEGPDHLKGKTVDEAHVAQEGEEKANEHDKRAAHHKGKADAMRGHDDPPANHEHAAAYYRGRAEHAQEAADAVKKKHKLSREVVYLSADAGPVTPAVTLVQGLPTHKTIRIGGEDRVYPLSYGWMDAIAAGDYVHPSTKQKLSVDVKRIDGWVNTFKAMRAKGTEVPAPATHSDDPRDMLGWVIDAKRNGDRLSLQYQIIGEPNALTAARNRCSVKIDPNYTDEHGNHWGDAIVHSAFTPKPVVTGMGEFVPFAASRDGETETPIFYLSADEGVPQMDPKELRLALGVAADVPDDKLIDKVRELKAESTALLSRTDKAERRVTELSRAPAKPSATELFFASKAVASARDEAIKAGAITPAVADIAEKRYVAKAIEAGKITLSRTVEDDDYKVVEGYAKLLDFYEVVKDNKPVPPAGSQTGVQLLSRETPGGEPDAATKAANESADAEIKRIKAEKGN